MSWGTSWGTQDVIMGDVAVQVMGDVAVQVVLRNHIRKRRPSTPECRPIVGRDGARLPRLERPPLHFTALRTLGTFRTMSASRRFPMSRFQPGIAAMYACTGASPSAFAICGLPPERSFGFTGADRLAMQKILSGRFEQW
jgi:hypothetical protein